MNHALAPKTRNLTEITQEIVSKLSAESKRLAEGIEMMCPGTNFGMWRHHHMQEASNNSEGLALAAQLSEKDAALLKIILCCHDFGRFVEFKLRFENKSGASQKLLNHGRYSAMIITELAEKGLFVGLEQEDIADVIHAVMWHGERIVDLPEESRARRLCYLLRDQDKLEIFAQDAFGHYEMGFCYKELVSALRVMTNEEIVACNERRDEVTALLTKYFDTLGVAASCPVPQNDPLLAKVYHACSRLAESDDEAVCAVLEKRSAEAMQCYKSFTDLFLLHTAMIFDLQYPHSFRMLREQRMMEVKWRFIEAHCETPLFAQLKNTIEAFIDQKLSSVP